MRQKWVQCEHATISNDKRVLRAIVYAPINSDASTQASKIGRKALDMLETTAYSDIVSVILVPDGDIKSWEYKRSTLPVHSIGR